MAARLSYPHEKGKAVQVSIVIPLYNQVMYTRLCLESLRTTLTVPVQIILVDNASSDETANYLKTLSDVTVISNEENLGFAGACNQGIRAAGGDWVVILNNDVIVAPGWLEGLLEAAQYWGLQIVTPAIREGKHDYDIAVYSRELTGRMQRVIRRGRANGICFMAHKRVFEAIGLFDEQFRIGQYEDKDFFLRASKAGFKLGTVGCSFLHHFGSVTQNSMKTARVVKPYAIENKAYFTRKWKLSWWERALARNCDRLATRFYSLRERLRYGHTLMEKLIDGKLRHE